jgi:hypothetical protein
MVARWHVPRRAPPSRRSCTPVLAADKKGGKGGQKGKAKGKVRGATPRVAPGCERGLRPYMRPHRIVRIAGSAHGGKQMPFRAGGCPARRSGACDAVTRSGGLALRLTSSAEERGAGFVPHRRGGTAQGLEDALRMASFIQEAVSVGFLEEDSNGDGLDEERWRYVYGGTAPSSHHCYRSPQRSAFL